MKKFITLLICISITLFLSCSSNNILSDSPSLKDFPESVKWNYSISGKITSNPAIYYNSLIFANSSGEIVNLDMETGAEKYDKSIDVKANKIIIHRNYAFCSGYYPSPRIVMLELDYKNILWANRVFARDFAVCDSFLFIISENKLDKYNFYTKKKVKSIEEINSRFDKIAMASDIIICFTQKGGIITFDKNLELLNTYKIKPLISEPILFESKLYFCTSSSIYSFDVEGESLERADFHAESSFCNLNVADGKIYITTGYKVFIYGKSLEQEASIILPDNNLSKVFLYNNQLFVKSHIGHIYIINNPNDIQSISHSWNDNGFFEISGNLLFITENGNLSCHELNTLIGQMSNSKNR